MIVINDDPPGKTKPGANVLVTTGGSTGATTKVASAELLGSVLSVVIGPVSLR